MENFEDVIKYLGEQEKKPIDYCKIGVDSKNLIVSFSCAYVNWYERKSSILQLKYERNDFDVLYFKSPGTWYLEGIRGIGKSINDTISFLKNEFSKYEKVICVGISAGGYASILYGSLLKAHYVIATRPQTDLDYTISNCSPVLTTALCSSPELYQASIGLHKSITNEVFQKYKNLKTIINSFTTYYVGGNGGKCGWHGEHHWHNISEHKNVIKLEHNDNINSIIADILKVRR